MILWVMRPSRLAVKMPAFGVPTSCPGWRRTLGVIFKIRSFVSLCSDLLTTHLYLFPVLSLVIGWCPVGLFPPLFHQTENVLSKKWKAGSGSPGRDSSAGFLEGDVLRASCWEGGEHQTVPLRGMVGGCVGGTFHPALSGRQWKMVRRGGVTGPPHVAR